MRADRQHTRLTAAQAAAQRADIFIAINASTVELADLGGWLAGLGWVDGWRVVGWMVGRPGWHGMWCVRVPLPSMRAVHAPCHHCAAGIRGCCTAEAYCEETAKERVVVAWNMELDTLRSDLGEEAGLAAAAVWW